MKAEEKIVGIDIFWGSPSSKKSPKYSLYSLPEGRVYEGVSRRKMIRIVNQLSPQIIAVDNIYELATDRERLISLVKKLQPSELVQVTSQGESLHNLAKRFGISFNRNIPSEEAKVCAILASMGIGHRVVLFEDKTKIEVRRGRRPGRGGWSENRFRRKIHGNVKRVSEIIEEILRKNGFKYEKEVREGYGGYISCVFLVEAPPSEIPISRSNLESGDVKIKISQVEKESIEFKPLSDGKEYLIVGIDPGTTTAIAALNLRGELIGLYSSREMSISDIVNVIRNFGKPVIVASDVTPVPNTLKKVKSAFNAILYEPKESLSVQTKMELTKDFPHSNAHERDAIAAALSAFKLYKNKFEQIERKVPIGMNADEVKAMVLKGVRISDVMTLKEEEEKSAEVLQTSDEALRKSYSSLVAKYKQLEEKLILFEETIEQKEKRIKQLEEELQRVKSEEYRKLKAEREISIRDREISRLRRDIIRLKEIIEEKDREIEELKKLISMKFSDSFVPMKVIQSFTKENVQKIHGSYGIKRGEIIYIRNPGGGGRNAARILAEQEVHAIIVEGTLSHQAEKVFEDAGIPVILAEDLEVHVFGDFGLVLKKELEKKILTWKSEQEKKKEKKIIEIIEEYRRSRKSLEGS